MTKLAVRYVCVHKENIGVVWLFQIVLENVGQENVMFQGLNSQHKDHIKYSKLSVTPLIFCSYHDS
jgi:hypothetical protein